MIRFLIAFAGAVAILPGAALSQSTARTQDAALPIGIFEHHGDVGTVLHPGSVSFNAATRTYTVSGSGDNMWFAKDAFHYVWTKAAKDVSLTADVSFPAPGREPHRKACLLIRQSLDADAAYVDIALHGDGLTSLQFARPKALPRMRCRRTSGTPRGCASRSEANTHYCT